MNFTKNNLKNVQQYHVDPEKRKYKCEHCAKGFSTNQALKDHVNIHSYRRETLHLQILWKNFCKNMSELDI